MLISLISTTPSNWNAQTLLPPLITFLAAYLALFTLYRTATWMLRTSLWIIKWGIILGALIAGAGWCMGGTNLDNGISNIAGFVLDTVNGQVQNTVDRSRKTSPLRRSSERRKPKIWDSFERYREWQDQGEDVTAANPQQILDDLMGIAGRAVRNSGWWTNGDASRQAKKGRRRQPVKTSNSRSR